MRIIKNRKRRTKKTRSSIPTLKRRRKRARSFRGEFGASSEGGCDATHIIEPCDVMYLDNLVCILKPGVKKGIIVWTHYTQPADAESVCVTGLKTGAQLAIEGIHFGREINHPYIFFRAPYYYCKNIDYSTPETEAISSYGHLKNVGKVFIRVDPNRTFVFSSEIRAEYCASEQSWPIECSKKRLTSYLRVIDDNKAIEAHVPPNQKVLYDLISSKASLFFKWQNPDSKEYNPHPINRNSEILVAIPHLSPEFFVWCTPPSTNYHNSSSSRCTTTEGAQTNVQPSETYFRNTQKSSTRRRRVNFIKKGTC